MKLEEKGNKIGFKTKKIAINRLGTKSDIKINQNQTLRDEIENIIQLKKDKKKIKKFKRMKIKFGT
jgi:hypothetical protein